MASISVTTYTLELIDEAERQAEVVANGLISKVLAFY